MCQQHFAGNVDGRARPRHRSAWCRHRAYSPSRVIEPRIRKNPLARV
jgi:hypothetical protein